jgi:uncharacterized HhH-GPD family protein
VGTKRPAKLHFTADQEANALIATDPFALLVGFAIDQQVPVTTAFVGPLKLKERLGTIDPKKIAKTDPGKLEEIFKAPPAIHRFPSSMSTRVHELAAVVVEDYGGDASRLWDEAEDSADLKKRIAALPGFGDMKVRQLSSVLAKRYGVAAAQELAPKHPALGDVDSADSLASYQAQKRAYKAAMRANQPLED